MAEWSSMSGASPSGLSLSGIRLIVRDFSKP
jgi:hypothetical protein